MSDSLEINWNELSEGMKKTLKGMGIVRCDSIPRSYFHFGCGITNDVEYAGFHNILQEAKVKFKAIIKGDKVKLERQCYLGGRDGRDNE